MLAHSKAYPEIRLLAVVALALLLAACEGQAPGSSGTADPSESVAAVATSAPCPAALIEGELVEDDTWVLVLRDTEGMTRQVIWPDGYTVSQRPPTVAVLDGSGTAVAFNGDHVTIGGGETGPDGAWNACGGISVIPVPSPTVEPSASNPSASPAAGAVVDCGRIDPAACETAIALARMASRPDDMTIATLVVVDDVCPPPSMCDRKYPFDSLVVFVPAGGDTTGWYAYEVTGLKEDTPTKAGRWQTEVPDHIAQRIRAALP